MRDPGRADWGQSRGVCVWRGRSRVDRLRRERALILQVLECTDLALRPCRRARRFGAMAAVGREPSHDGRPCEDYCPDCSRGDYRHIRLSVSVHSARHRTIAQVERQMVQIGEVDSKDVPGFQHCPKAIKIEKPPCTFCSNRRLLHDRRWWSASRRLTSTIRMGFRESVSRHAGLSPTASTCCSGRGGTASSIAQQPLGWRNLSTRMRQRGHEFSGAPPWSLGSPGD
jgi:hypothetical protein